MNIILPIKDIFIIAGNIVFSVLYNEHLEFPCRCQLLSSNSEVMQELYIEKELFIKRTTENDCRALVLRGTLEYLFDEIDILEPTIIICQGEWAIKGKDNFVQFIWAISRTPKLISC